MLEAVEMVEGDVGRKDCKRKASGVNVPIDVPVDASVDKTRVWACLSFSFLFSFLFRLTWSASAAMCEVKFSPENNFAKLLSDIM